MLLKARKLHTQQIPGMTNIESVQLRDNNSHRFTTLNRSRSRLHLEN